MSLMQAVKNFSAGCCTDLIYDVGMHNGDDTAFYLAKNFRVIAIEANPELADQARKKFHDEVENLRLTILNIGIAESNGVLPFYVNGKHSEWSSFDRDIGSREGLARVIDVPTTTLDKVMIEYGVPYYLKLDIEGFDFLALRQTSKLRRKPKYISVENGFPEMLSFLSSRGYSQFKFVNQALIKHSSETIATNDPNNPFEWHFPFGSSGSFGENAIGSWKSRDEILREILAYWGKPNRDENIDGWYDLHAAR